MQKKDLQKRTLKSLRKDPSLKKFLKGTSRMKKADLISHIVNKSSRKVSRKPKRQTSKKSSRKVARKPKRQTSKKSSRKVARKPKRQTSKKSSRKPKRQTSKKSSRKVTLKCTQLDGTVKKVSLTSNEITNLHPKKINFKASEWDLVWVPKGSLLMRGERKDSAHTQLTSLKAGQKRPIWYTRIPENAYSYIPYGAVGGQGGMLSVYETKKSLKLLNLNSVKNFKKLLALFKHDPTCIWPSPIRFWGTKTKVQAAKMRKAVHMRLILSSVFLGKITGIGNKDIDKRVDEMLNKNINLAKKGKGYSLEGLRRISFLDWDYSFAIWLCNNGFDGWIHPPKLPGLDPEEMICAPFDSLELVGRLDFPKGRGAKKDKSKVVKKIEQYIKNMYDSNSNSNCALQ